MSIPDSLEGWIAFAVVFVGGMLLKHFFPNFKLPTKPADPAKPDEPQDPDWLKNLVEEIVRKLMDQMRAESMGGEQKSYGAMVPLHEAMDARRKEIESLTNAPLTPKGKP
jgi:hypothetical protein